MIDLVNQNKEVKIDWFCEKFNMTKHIKALIEHEILHHGELVVYIRTLNLDFPDSWQEYGL